MTGDLRLSRHEMSDLIIALRRLPRLLDDLDDTVARQGVRGVKTFGRAVPKSRPPIDLDALSAGQDLNWQLYTAVRAVVEQRGIDYVPVATPSSTPDPRVWLSLAWFADTFVGPLHPRQRRAPWPELPAPPTTVELARWLDKHVVDFAACEDAYEMYCQILGAIRDCADTIDLPADGVVVVAQARVDAAHDMVLTADQIEKIATGLGPAGEGLTRDRVRYLAKCGLTPAAREGETKYYRLGDVLARHAAHRRNGRAAREPA